MYGPVSGRGRVFALLAAVGCLLFLGVGSWLRPAESGHGTHEQLGLPACRWAEMLGRPCPTCGMTTAFSHAAHGDLGSAFGVQPMGTVIAVLVAVGFWGLVHVGVSGVRLGFWFGKVVSPPVLWVLAGIGAASWAYKWFTWTG